MRIDTEQTIGELLRVVYHRMDMDDAATENEVRKVYFSTVGDLISKLTWSVRFDKGTLWVSLSSAALRTELSYKKESLMMKINENLGRKVVNDIIFK